MLFQVKRTESGESTETFNLKFFPGNLSLSQFPGLMFSLPTPPVARRGKNIGKSKLLRCEVRAVPAMRRSGVRSVRSC